MNNWERYWSSLSGRQGEAPWDAEPEYKAERHVSILKSYFANELPLVDFGCGNGTQTSFLAPFFPRTVGLDIAESAVSAARVTHAAIPGLEFRALDVLDAVAVSALHDELGDCNVYEDTMLHTLPSESQAEAIGNLSQLMGTTGRMFILELAPHGMADLAALVEQDQLTDLPKLRRVLAAGITVAALSSEGVTTLLERHGLEVIGRGTESVLSTDVTSNGQRVSLPTHWTAAQMRR